MKLENIKYLAIAFILSLSVACQKGITDEITTTTATGNTTTTTTDKVKTYTEDVTTAAGHSVLTYNLTYDANDRLLTEISASSPGDKFIYQYNTNNTFTLDLYNSNVVSIHTLYYLNNASFIDSAFQYNSTNDTSTQKYTYNSSNQLVKFTEYDYKTSTGAVLYDTHTSVVDANGNTTSDTGNNDVSTFDYYTNLLNTLNTGKDFVGRNKNLTKTTTYTSGGTTVVYNHTYTFDGSNRLSTEKMVGNNGDVLIKTYTY